MKKLFIDFSHKLINWTCTEETKELITVVNDKSNEVNQSIKCILL